MNNSNKINQNKIAFILVLSILAVFGFAFSYSVKHSKANKELVNFEQIEEDEIEEIVIDSTVIKLTERIEILEKQIKEIASLKKAEKVKPAKTQAKKVTKAQKKEYVISLIESLSKSDVRQLNDFLGYIEGGYYFNTSAHHDYPHNPEALRIIESNIYEVLELLNN